MNTPAATSLGLKICVGLSIVGAVFSVDIVTHSLQTSGSTLDNLPEGQKWDHDVIQENPVGVFSLTCTHRDTRTHRD